MQEVKYKDFIIFQGDIRYSLVSLEQETAQA